MKKVFAILGMVAVLTFLTSCNKNEEVELPPPEPPIPPSPINSPFNKPPIANAGSDTIISLPVNQVLLNGSASYDPDGKIEQFIWKPISGPYAGFFNSSSATPTLSISTSGAYQFELTVTDDGKKQGKDTVGLIVNDYISPPHLNGLEVEFNNLIWQLDADDLGHADIYMFTPERADLFLNYYVKVEVFMKFDTGHWIKIKPWIAYEENSTVEQFIYGIYSRRLYVFVQPLNHQLIGKKASIKVKFQ